MPYFWSIHLIVSLNLIPSDNCVATFHMPCSNVWYIEYIFAHFGYSHNLDFFRLKIQQQCLEKIKAKNCRFTRKIKLNSIHTGQWQMLCYHKKKKYHIFFVCSLYMSNSLIFSIWCDLSCCITMKIMDFCPLIWPLHQQ